MTTKLTTAPDPELLEDAGQYIAVSLMDHVEQCSEEECFNDTRLKVQTQDDADAMPYCNGHVHVLFADWMVGA